MSQMSDKSNNKEPAPVAAIFMFVMLITILLIVAIIAALYFASKLGVTAWMIPIIMR